MLILAAATLAVYWPACGNGFVYDDDRYVAENRHVKAGLTGPGIHWALTTTHAANWHPLTWLSLQLDSQLFGTTARGYHRTNLILHAANVVLLYWLLRRLTGAVWRSMFVAALFALHPLHVESVAWVSERKDVLSTLFWLLTMLAYVRYVEQPGWRRYLLVVLPFMLGLMAKPMLVTLPFVLLLVDYWPLKRVARGAWRVAGEAALTVPAPPVDDSSAPATRHPPPATLLWEKLPLFVLSACACVVTWYAQRQGHAVQSLEHFPLPLRLCNALVAYDAYLGKTFWPVGLAPFYPHPGRDLSAWAVVVAVLALSAISVLVWRARRRFPYLTVGWLWFVGTLVPVIGLVQVGGQAWADRYSYVPHIGLFLGIVWGLAEVTTRWRCPELGFLAGGIALVACALLTWLQVHYWRDSISLWQHALEVTEPNPVAMVSLGKAKEQQDQLEDAILLYQQALQLQPGSPNHAETHNNLGVALWKLGYVDEAIQHYREALKLYPGHALAYSNLGVALGGQGKTEEAIRCFREALRLNPDLENAHFNLGVALAQQGHDEEAIRQYREELRLNPDHLQAHSNLGLVLAAQGRTEEAAFHQEAVRRLDPRSRGR